MKEKPVQKLVVLTKGDGDGFQLTSRERSLIANFRAVKSSAQDMLLDLAEQYRRTLPAETVKLRLLGPREGDASL